MSSGRSQDCLEEEEEEETANVDAQLKQLQRSFWHLKRVFNDLQEKPEGGNSLQYGNDLTRVIEQMLKVAFVQRKKLIFALEKHREELVKIDRKIEFKLRRVAGKRKKKHSRFRILLKDESFRNGNGKESFYFRGCSTTTMLPLLQEHVDFDEIVSTGHVFLGCLSYSNPWRLSDASKLMAAVRSCLVREKLEELQSTLDTIDILTKQNPDTAELEALRQRSNRLNTFLLTAENVDMVNLLKEEADDRDFDWRYVSKKYFGSYHSAADCCRMWHLVAKPSICKGAWSAAEDLLLREIAIENGLQNWSRVAGRLSTNRGEFLCFVRHQTLFKAVPRRARRVWTRHENVQIENMLNVTELSSSSSLSNFVFNICGKFDGASRSQILSHVRHLSNTRRKKKGFFSRRERFLIQFCARRGHSYAATAQILGNRTCKQIRDYRRSTGAKWRHGTWSREEVRDLLRSVKYIGEQRWTKVSRYVEGRSASQCRHKYWLLKRKRKCSLEMALMESATTTSGTKRKLKSIKRLLKKEETIEKSERRREMSIDEKIETYFVERLESRKRLIEKKTLMGSHVLSLLNFLKFKVRRAGIPSDAIADALIAYSSSSDVKVFRNVSLIESTKDVVMSYRKGSSVFSHVLHQYNNVVPPNRCCMYGLRKFIDNYESFVAANGVVDFENLWRKIDVDSKRDKRFVEAKIRWFRMLKAVFYWSIKLKQATAEQIFTDL